MPDLPTKADFLAHRLVACPVPDEDTDCPICQEQFTSAPSTLNDITESDSTSLPDGATNEDAESRVPTRMLCCNNVFCHRCITAWLNSANTCPTCRVQLFEVPEPEPEPEPDPSEFDESDESDGSDYEGEYYEEEFDVLMQFDTDD
ncbi:hypothetical protein COCMIDRAFT_85338 [Bipolaris oryzae ATCC 44560]|uniref:RING-type domain-containing protein n=1 Tax=Bipolaris oryzae ATCC 44560 TaxID=930090 RepID=W6ZZE9_COCMI|nr:uncharacterized protein COCMIDRAFT_85338 [Bipolaris oryzae ATCC 44560]EUC49136.1 hypothetical protein COCMIDRAFT_85338 [Bipolaris oryzae ATCC 44560]